MSTKEPKGRRYGSIEEESMNDDPVHASHGGDLPGDDDTAPDHISPERRRALEAAAEAAAEAELEGYE